MANLRILIPFKFLSKWKTSNTPTWTVLVNQNVSATFSNRLAILHDFAHHKALLLPVRAPTCVTWGRGYPWNTEGAWKTKDLKDVDDLRMCRKGPIQRGWKVDKEGSSNSWWRPDPCTHLKDQVKWPSYSDAICSTCGMDFPLHASVATSPRIQEFEVILRNVCPIAKKTKKRPMFSCSGTSTFFLCETSRQAIHRFPTSSATREPAGVGADARHGTLVHIVTVASEVDNGGTSRRRISTAGGDGEPLPSRSNNAEFGWFRPIPNIFPYLIYIYYIYTVYYI